MNIIIFLIYLVIIIMFFYNYVYVFHANYVILLKSC